MAEELKKVTDEQIKESVKRLEELQNARKEVAKLKGELTQHEEDLKNAETIYGVDSKEYKVQKDHIELTNTKITDAEKKVSELSFKKSELKPVLDTLAKKFEENLKADTMKDYHIEITTTKKDENGNLIKEQSGNGKKVFKQLLDYLYHNVTFTPKTAANLMVLVRNMEENKAWVNSKDFDNVILLRSASVLSLWRFIIDDMSGKGFYEARTFLECWANCGDSISEAVRQIQKDNEGTRKIGSQLNSIEDEFDRSEDDLPKEEETLTIQEEVAPEVAE